VIDCTSKPDAELREFIDLVTLDIIEALEPYAAAIAQFKAFHEQKMSGGGNITRLRMVVERRVKREQAGGAGNDIDVAALYNLMAIAYLMDRNEAEATALLERAVATAPEFGVPNLNLALLNLMHQRPDAALALVRTASQSPMIAASPVLAANAETIEAIVLWQKGDLPSASAHFLKAVKTYPRSFFGYYYWSELARSIGNLDDAALLRKRAETNLAANETYPEIGLLYFLGHPGKAGDLDFRLVDTDKVRSLADLERQGGG
jgi:tetratricopeptide (TPR) repeat protein